MRLKGQQQTLTGESTACRGNGRLHFNRMVSIVIDQRKTSAAGNRHFAKTLEATVHTRELIQCLDDVTVGDTDFAGHGNRGQCVQNVVHAGQIERYRKAAGAAVDAHTIELHLAIGRHDVLGAHAG